MNELLESLLAEQKKTNQLLLMLIEALAGDEYEGDDDQLDAQTYLNGSPKNRT